MLLAAKAKPSILTSELYRDPKVPFAPVLIFPNAIFVTLIVASSALQQSRCQKYCWREVGRHLYHDIEE